MAGSQRGKKRKAEEAEEKKEDVEAPSTPSTPTLSRTKTMQETAKVAKDFLKRVGHETHSPLSKTANRRETRSQHKVRSAVETLLSDEKKQPVLQVDEVETYKNQLKMVFRLIDSKHEKAIDQDQLISVMKSLGKRPRQEKIQKIMEELDKEKTGKVTLDAFVEYMLAKRHVKEEDDEDKKVINPDAVPVPKPGEDKKADEPAADAPAADKGKKKAAEEPEPPLPAIAHPGLAVLNRASSILNYYTENAGIHDVPVEGWEGPDRDLGKNNAFNSFSILLMNFNTKAPLNGIFTLAHEALHLKGFSVVEVNTEEELIDYANSFDEVWIASSDQPTKNPERIIEELRKLHHAGKGIGIWAGGDPYVEQANLILKALVGAEVSGSYAGKGSLKLVGTGNEANAPSTLARSILTTGLNEITEGVVYCRLNDLPNGAQVLGRSAQNLPNLVTWEGSSRSGYIFLNCALVSLAKTEEQLAAERRFLSNIGVWLLGLEDRMRLGLRLVGDIQASAADVTWEYFLNRNQDGKKAGWHPYEEQANKIVEAAFQKYVGSSQADNNIRAYITVHSGNFTYEVDFKTMVQKNIAHENHTVRKIRRVGDE